MSKKNLGLVRVGAAVPALKVANTNYNSDEMIKLIKEAEKEKAGFLLFPELCITGYSCGDLLFQEHLYSQQLEGLKKIKDATSKLNVTVIVGVYLRLESNLYNCAVLIQRGTIKGVVPKMFVPNYNEYYEARWFSSGIEISKNIDHISLLGEKVPFGTMVFTDYSSRLCVGLEICEDLWLPISPGAQLSLSGAQILFNTSASNETVGKAGYRRDLISVSSGKNACGYVYASAGINESTTDVVFSGHALIAENGAILAENKRFQRESSVTYSEIDFQRLAFERSHQNNFSQCTSAYNDRERYVTVPLKPIRLVDENENLRRKYAKNPFLPQNPSLVNIHCEDIFNIQAAGLSKRLLHTHSKKTVLGISGGLDSTLALLVCSYTHQLLDKDSRDIISVTMPGFGTSDKTYNNALTIMRLLGTDTREISIRDSVLLHFKDIGQDEKKRDTTYENSQARERTQILMDIANKEGGIVVGTGDLSETALGWCTYNGDHMSMYGVNSSVPKSLIKFVVKWFIDNILSGDNAFSSDDKLLAETLQDVLDTPISPELLPPDEEGDIAQKTEENVGPYILHDFFLYYTMRFGTPPAKLLFLAKTAFREEYSCDFIKKCLSIFYRRFFSQQFKRSCMPDGPKVGSVSLSPRGDWRMPSDADASLWLEQL